MDEQKEPLINHNPSLQSYYTSLESRIGYRLFLGGTRHFGYYQPMQDGLSLFTLRFEGWKTICSTP